MAVTITTPGGSVVLADTGDFVQDSKWLLGGEQEGVKVGARKYQYEYVYAAGVNGAGTKNYGFRDQMITIQCVYVGASANAVLSTIMTDLNDIASGKNSVAHNGQTYPRCFLEPTGEEVGQIRYNGLPTAKYFAIVKMKFRNVGIPS